MAVHHVEAGDPLDGTTHLGFEADDLDQVLAGLPDSVDAELVDVAHGRTLRITGPDGLVFLVDRRVPGAVPMVPAEPELPYRVEVSQMWLAPRRRSAGTRCWPPSVRPPW